MRYRALHLLPVNADISQGHYEQGAPEDEVGQGDYHKHLHLVDPLLLQHHHLVLHLQALGVRDYNNVLRVCWAPVRGIKSVDPQIIKTRDGGVLVQLVQVVHGQHDAQAVDEDPDGIKNIMSIGTL